MEDPTDEANVCDVIDDGSAVNLRQGRKEHGSSCESQHIDRNAESSQLFTCAAEFHHEVGDARCKHSYRRAEVSCLQGNFAQTTKTCFVLLLKI